MLEIVDCIRSPIFCQCQYQTFPDSKRCIFCNSNVVSQTNTAFGVTCCAEKRFVRQEVRKRSRSVTLALHRHAAVCCGGSGVISWFCGLDSCKALHSVLLTIACTWLMDTSECCFWGAYHHGVVVVTCPECQTLGCVYAGKCGSKSRQNRKKKSTCLLVYHMCVLPPFEGSKFGSSYFLEWDGDGKSPNNLSKCHFFAARSRHLIADRLGWLLDSIFTSPILQRTWALPKPCNSGSMV